MQVCVSQWKTAEGICRTPMASCISGQMESNWIPAVLTVHWTCCSLFGLAESYYHHFLTLTVAMSILLDSDDETRDAYNAYAEQLLICFYKTSTKLYSPIFPSDNVHSLVHLPEDVWNFGTSVNEICTFPFENHLQKLKKSVRNANIT